jgi:hypothetical protein
VRNRFFPTARFVQRCPCLLPASEAVMPVRRRPHGQNRERLPTGPTSPATNPDAAMSFIVRLLAPPAMAHDGLMAANRTPSRQQLQGERRHPDSGLFSPSGSAIKRIKAGVKARPLNAPPKAQSGCGTSPSGKVSSNEKRIPLSNCSCPRFAALSTNATSERTCPNETSKSNIGRYTYPLW